MTGVARVALAVGLTFASITPAYGSAPDRTVRCGGFPFGEYEVPFVFVKTANNPQHLVRVKAVAPVIEVASPMDLRAKAWLMWDDYAHTWLVTTDASPEDLKIFRTKLPTMPTQLPRSSARITYIEKPDPWIFGGKYELAGCPSVDAAQSK